MIASLPFTSSHAEWIGLVVGVISLIGIGGIVSHLLCHHTGCFRLGRFRLAHYRLCHVHHPHVPSDGKITMEHIEAVGRDEALGSMPGSAPAAASRESGSHTAEAPRPSGAGPEGRYAAP